MFKKECCKKCRIENYSKFTSIVVSNWGWVLINEEDWNKKKTVDCPIKYINRKKGEKITNKINGKPPKNCPYYLENLL